jgi:hypothetical protein
MLFMTWHALFLNKMNMVIPWAELLALMALHAPAGNTGRWPFATQVEHKLGPKILATVHVTTTAAHTLDVTQAHTLLHGEEKVVFADSGYRSVHKRKEIQA